MKHPVPILALWILVGLAYASSANVRASLWASGVLTTTPDTWVARVTPTGSMEPTLTPKDWLIYRHLPFGQVRPGDIISFRCPEDGTPVTHRVVRRLEDGRLITRGDGNPAVDPWTVGPEQYRGVLVAVYTD